MKPILIISFWNPTASEPGKGNFIREQVDALCKQREGIIFLEVNILNAPALFSVNVMEEKLFLGKQITCNISSRFWKFIYVAPWLVYRILKGILQKHDASFSPEIVHSNVVFPCGIVGHLFAKKYNARHVISEHWSRADKMSKHPLFGKPILKAYRQSSAVICVSEFLANKVKTVSGIKPPVIIPNIIDTSLFKFVTKVPSPQNLRFTCVATWKKPKRLDLIIESLERFGAETTVNITLNVVGEGPQKGAYSAKKWPANMNVNWLGHIAKPQIAALLTQTDIFLHASDIETFSIVTAEALSTGTPVLASNVGALPGLINLSNGILVENTIEAWLQGLHNIVNARFDYAAISQGVSDRFSPLSVARQIETVYYQVLHEK